MGCLVTGRHKIIATVFFIVFTFYSGLGVLNPTDYPNEKLIMAVPIAIFILYSAFLGFRLSKRDTLMYALLMFAVLFILARLMPSVRGYSGFLLFALLLGRLVGIQHPPSEIEQPLDSKRVVLGWIALIVFVLCFSPAPLELNLLMKNP